MVSKHLIFILVATSLPTLLLSSSRIKTRFLEVSQVSLGMELRAINMTLQLMYFLSRTKRSLKSEIVVIMKQFTATHRSDQDLATDRIYSFLTNAILILETFRILGGLTFCQKE